MEKRARLLVAAAAATFVVACTGEAPPSIVCPPGETSIVVSTGAHELAACKHGKAELRYAVAVGRGGTGKTIEGDRKTPLGEYPLGPPRLSKKFRTFIPIGYPTERQIRDGLTGSNVGIHGPSRFFAWLGPSSVWTDWTLGCIALARDADIDTLADWVRREQPIAVRIR